MIDDDDEDGLMEIVELFLSLLGQGSSIADIFGGGGVSFKDIITLLINEIQAVFILELASEDVRQAAAAVQSVTDWMSNVYTPLQSSGTANPALLNTLSGGVISDQIAMLEQWSNVMRTWAAESATDISQQTTSLALTMQGVLVAYYQEISKVTDDPSQKSAALQSVKLYASEGVTRITPLFQSVKTARFSGISDVAVNGNDGYSVGGYVRDTWVGDPSGPVLNVFRELTSGSVLFYSDGASFDVVTQSMTLTRQAYISLLQSGTDSDKSVLSGAVSDGSYSGSSDMPSASGDALIAHSIPNFQATGRWLTMAPTALLHLQQIAND